MLRHSLRDIAWAVALAATSAVTLPDPPTAGERALLGRAATREAGSSNLRITRLDGQVSAGRALLGKLSASEEELAAEGAIQIRPRYATGEGALLGRP